MAKENYRSRSHMLLLYPDNTKHVLALEKVQKSYDHAYILHDRDIYDHDVLDENGNIEHKKGDFKKPHWHVVIRFNNGTWANPICDDLGIDLKFIEQVKRFDNALQYLIHYNDTEKAQYAVSEVEGNLKVRLVESINKLEKSEGEKVVELIEYINGYEGRLSITEFASFCAANGYWAEFRRSGAIFCKIIEEHNSQV